VLLQPKLNLKVSQRQVLTPGLVQMVSVLALNKLELKDMINSEMIENPVLEELEETGTSLDERTGVEGDRERSAEEVAAEGVREEKDPFDEIDFGSYFQDYLDPGFKTASNFEEYDKPSFEHFLSQPSTLTDHLLWQLGSLTLTPEVEAAAELIIGNLDPNGYLTASDEELAEALTAAFTAASRPEPIPFDRALKNRVPRALDSVDALPDGGVLDDVAAAAAPVDPVLKEAQHTVRHARKLILQLDPLGVGARDLRECLLIQIEGQRREASLVLRPITARRCMRRATQTVVGMMCFRLRLTS
jgi:RNA polymerase sigma-54 factor